MAEPGRDSENAERWQRILMAPHQTPLFHLPTDPRCQVCGMPFAGIGGVLGRVAGFRRWNKNPSLCNRCVKSMPDGGIELDVSVIFADVRGSTGLGERLGPAEFAGLLNDFYEVGSKVLIRNKAIIDKMIGDEIMAFFVPLAGADYRRKSVESAIQMMQAFSEQEWRMGPLQVGIGVHAGAAYVGRVGEKEAKEFTALGDTVNVAARLQAEAGAGEVVVSEELHSLVADDFPSAESRMLVVRGREESINARIIRVGKHET